MTNRKVTEEKQKWKKQRQMQSYISKITKEFETNAYFEN